MKLNVIGFQSHVYQKTGNICPLLVWPKGAAHILLRRIIYAFVLISKLLNTAFMFIKFIIMNNVALIGTPLGFGKYTFTDVCSLLCT